MIRTRGTGAAVFSSEERGAEKKDPDISTPKSNFFNKSFIILNLTQRSIALMDNKLKSFKICKLFVLPA
jgi:hypothetical protein